MKSEITHKDIPKLIDEIGSDRVAPVYLLYGDEFFYKSAFKSLLDALVPAHHQGFNYESMDGASENVYKIIEHLNTFPLIPSVKVIAVHGTTIFYSAVAVDDLLERSKKAFEKEDLKESARHILRMLSVAGKSLDDVKDGNTHGGGAWLDQVVAYCEQEKMAVPIHQDDDADVLNKAIVEGYPKTNHLVLTTEFVDKRRKLYKTISKIGVAIDCTVAKGERRAEKTQQQNALRSFTTESLKKAGKTMAPGGFDALYEKISAEMRSFSNELDKLIAFVGDRKNILPSDIETVSKRTKQDPIFEMTSAIAERDTRRALFVLDSLLRNNFFPLQVLSAASKQIRKLILAKDFIRCRCGNGWRQELSYAAFQKTILPELEKREPDLLTSNAHPFAIHMTLKQSENYTFEEIIGALEVLLDADIRLKTSGQDAKTILERAILHICGV
ncbi:MAG: hypothetical protein BA865_04305 [Desulfobacterales bacterium S5133MH4]|nr:MAG: hypothetical protein BA865_04305 [Desulfobacterales bacterium S5133MH4]